MMASFNQLVVIDHPMCQWCREKKKKTRWFIYAAWCQVKLPVNQGPGIADGICGERYTADGWKINIS